MRESSLKEMNELNARKQALLDEVKAHTQRINALKTNISELEARHASLDEFIASLVRKLAELNSECAQATRKIKEEQNAFKKREDEIQALIDESVNTLDAANKEKQEARSLTAQAKEAQAKAVAEQVKLVEESAKIKEELERLHAARESVLQSMADADINAERTKKQLEITQNERKAFEAQQSELTQAQLRMNISESAMKQKLYEIDILKTEQAQLVQSNIDKAAELEALIAQNKALEASLHKERESVEQDRKRNEIDKLRLDKLAREKQLDKELADLRNGH